MYLYPAQLITRLTRYQPLQWSHARCVLLFSSSNRKVRIASLFAISQCLYLREVEELVTNNFPYLHLSSNCHCPPSHPVVSNVNTDRCVQHTGRENCVPLILYRMPTGVATGRGSVIRINTNSHTVGYANDNSYTTSWVSAINQRDANLTISLIEGSKSAYEVSQVSIMTCLLMLFIDCICIH